MSVFVRPDFGTLEILHASLKFYCFQRYCLVVITIFAIYFENQKQLVS